MLASRNVKENGFGIPEKRMRDVEGRGGSYGATAAAGNGNGGECLLSRGFQDCPEAPPRKRVHLPAGEVAQGEKGDAQKESVGNVYPHFDPVTIVDEEKGPDSGRLLPARFPPPTRSVSHQGEQDNEMFPEQATIGNDASGGRISAPGVERSTAAEMHIDPSSSDGKVYSEDRVDSAGKVGVGSAGKEEAAYQERRDCGSGCPVSSHAKDDSQHSAERLGKTAGSGALDPTPANQELLGVCVEEFAQGTTERFGESAKAGCSNPTPSKEEFRCWDHQEESPSEHPRPVGVIDVDDDVEIIEFDSDEDDEPESNGSSTRDTTKPTNNRGRYTAPSSQFTSPSCSLDEESDSDDCQVLGSRQANNGPPWMGQTTGRNRDASPSPVVLQEDDEESESESMSDKSDSSDVEEIVNESDIRRMWEEAAMRKRMGRTMQSEGSKANGEHEGTSDLDEARIESPGFEEGVATSTYHGSPDSRDQTESPDTRGDIEVVVNATVRQHGASSVRAEGEKSGADNDISPDSDLQVEVGNLNGTSSPGAELGGIKVRNEQDETNFAKGAAVESTREDLLAGKEKLKQTAHYITADAAEWACRQQEIQRQAMESQRLRQRKRIEADRKAEMERKQKQRVEELRLTQMKEEKSMGLREQLRGQVHFELEQIASSCHDFATLLRRFGIQVEGGTHPSIQQVNAAYKKALFKFHPDRAVTSTRGDPRHQVEAEEKFKLISRLRGTLLPVAIEGQRPLR